MMSSLLFYHKRKIPSLASLTVRGVVGSSGSARSGPEGLLLRVKLANPKVCAPRPRRKGESRGRGAEGERDVRAGSLSLLLEGLGKMRGQGALHCAPGRATRLTFPSVAPSMYPLSHSAIHTPSERDGNRTRRSLGFGGPTVPRAHAHDSFPDYRSANQAGADGRPFASSRLAGFGVAQTPTVNERQKSLLLQFALLRSTGIVAHAAHLTSSAIVHVALLSRGITLLNRLSGAPVGGSRTVFKETHEGFHPLSAAVAA